MGNAGAQGAVGERGEQGASIEGPQGPSGPRGPAGEQGYSGDTGAQGATLVGPTGRAGRTGDTGMQGETGQTGGQGPVMAGIQGDVGPSGEEGVRGEHGSMGNQGVVGIVDRWTAYRELRFDRASAQIPSYEMDSISEIAAYMAHNPSLEVGIDSSSNDRDLADSRANSVRSALMHDGVPSGNIRIGTFGDRDRSHEGQVQVLIKTRRQTADLSQ